MTGSQWTGVGAALVVLGAVGVLYVLRRVRDSRLIREQYNALSPAEKAALAANYGVTNEREAVARVRVLELDAYVEPLGGAGSVVTSRPLLWLYEQYVIFSSWAWFVPLCLFLLIASGAVMRELDWLLRAMHVPGAAALSMTDLVGVRSLWAGSDNPGEVLRTWTAWFADTSKNTDVLAVVDPRSLAWLWLLIDTAFFVFAYTSLFGVLLVRAGARLASGQGPANPQRSIAYRRLVAVALVGVPLLALADLLENYFAAGLVEHPGDHARFWAYWGFSLTKWSLGVLIALPLVAAWISIGASATAGVHPFRSALVTCRVQLLLVVAFALLLLGPQQASGQAADVIRRWIDDWWTVPLPVVVTLVFALFTLLSGRWLIDRVDALAPGRGFGWIRLVVLAGVAIVFGVVAFVLLHWHVLHGGQGLYVAAGIALAIAGLSAPVWALTTEPPPAQPSAFVASVLAAVPPVALGLAVIRGGAGEYFYSHNNRAIALIAIGILLQLAGWLLYFAGTRKEAWFVSAGGDLWLAWKVFLATVAVVAVAGGIVVAADPWRFVRALNTIGVVAGFLLLALVVGFALVWLAEVVPPPGAFLVFRLKRIPVLTLLLVWLIAASVVDKTGAYHNVRTTFGRDIRPLTLTTAFNAWLGRQGLVPFDENAKRSAGPKTKAIPLVFVSAAGGGIRAGFWTAVVLDCVLEGQGGGACERLGAESGSGRVFAESGISGGSVGLVEYGAHRLHPEALIPGGGWIDTRLGGDYAAPTIAAMLFRDAPNAFLRLRDWDDRAAVLERAWERSWPETDALEDGYLADEESGRLPLLLLNGTSVTDGCRFNTSLLESAFRAPEQPLVEDCLSLRPFERNPADCGSDCKYVSPDRRHDWVLAATKDIDDTLCSEQTGAARVLTDDVRLSTAALLSARFPWVSPSGRITCKYGGRPTSYVVDGGYFDTSGASPIVELWQALQPMVGAYNRQAGNDTCIVPVFIQIDNHYSEPHGPKPDARPGELLVPPTTLGHVRDAREANAREAAALEFSGEIAPDEKALAADGKLADRIAHVFPRAHPGTQAPLGWTLSKASKRDLHRQLSNRFNREEIAKARSWFAPNALRCRVS